MIISCRLIFFILFLLHREQAHLLWCSHSFVAQGLTLAELRTTQGVCKVMLETEHVTSLLHQVF